MTSRRRLRSWLLWLRRLFARLLPCSLRGRELAANGGLREGSNTGNTGKNSAAAPPLPQPPRNYGDWRHLLEDADRCPADLAQALRHGDIPAGATPQIFDLIRRFCERVINREGRRLSQALEEISVTDVDGIIMLCRRYSNSCERLLFVTDVPGMPEHEGGQLVTQIRDHVAGVLHSVATGIGNGGDGGASPEADDTAYVIRRLERRWMRT
ncbi:hypothetical protein JS532_08680 [Bifidobacterium callimiconis]|uniref:hypothetical protein n=1 Tax=Bifidobacterium callimiconis TaxID=2306973 RepID=UPI001BDD39E5|nr:hypothetical protein [Bifidobacterium callimiconis]MBT1177629.1 hypothetical protein [Bifidobacterium callimiconis]